MIEYIQSETREIIYNCCERYAKKKGIEIENIQLILGINKDGNTYSLCERFNPKEHLSINEVLGVRIDFTGKSLIAPPFIRKSLFRFAEQYKLNPIETKILCIPSINEKGKPDVMLYVYKGNEKNKLIGSLIEEITFAKLFREEDIEMPT
jgi:hypothetical protein